MSDESTAPNDLANFAAVPRKESAEPVALSVVTRRHRARAMKQRLRVRVPQVRLAIAAASAAAPAASTRICILLRRLGRAWPVRLPHRKRVGGANRRGRGHNLVEADALGDTGGRCGGVQVPDAGTCRCASQSVSEVYTPKVAPSSSKAASHSDHAEARMTYTETLAGSSSKGAGSIVAGRSRCGCERRSRSTEAHCIREGRSMGDAGRRREIQERYLAAAPRGARVVTGW